ncbi:MAG: hypothetical protein RIC30_01015 [Marinoscillum sp.]|uniref:hypothetical protein n=1 Tax=Marinoscillum sp. TaxID=2024838 RepID=UPI0032F5F603
MMKNMIAVLLMMAFWTGYAQDEEKAGTWSGQWRTYYLSTFNHRQLKDFHALATGGKVKYVHSLGEHFQLGGALYTSFNLGIQDLTEPDQTTGKLSRYEVGLFDANNPGDRLVVIPGELFVRYKNGAHELTLGRMKIVSPFLNPEDGRMIPTLEQGLWYKFAPKSNYKVQLGAFNAIAPRSTSGFYGIGESIGKYPVGRSVDGSASEYAGHTHSAYILLGNVAFTPVKALDIEVWNYYADNVFNTFYIKPVLSHPNEKLSIALEWLHQDRVGDGGNSIDSLRYFSHSQANVLGAETTMVMPKGKISLGYDHILDGGRFLFPREWGREFLFSFQKRERSEGTANNHALLLTYERIFKLNTAKLKTITSMGHHWKPDVTNAEDNKYAVPDYSQLNLDLFYLSDKWTNLKPELLLVYKKSSGDFPDNPNFILNKVDLFQVNFIVNYDF